MAKAQAKSESVSDAAIRELREYGLQYPGAHLKSPWPGHKDLAVKDKTFAYLPPEGEPFSIGCKLPTSSGIALLLPFCVPTGYGLGKSGWVSATPSEDQIDLAMFKQWIDESYRAQAPKSLVKQIAISPSSAARSEPAAPAQKPAKAAKSAKPTKPSAKPSAKRAKSGAKRTRATKR